MKPIKKQTDRWLMFQTKVGIVALLAAAAEEGIVCVESIRAPLCYSPRKGC